MKIKKTQLLKNKIETLKKIYILKHKLKNCSIHLDECLEATKIRCAISFYQNRLKFLKNIEKLQNQ